MELYIPSPYKDDQSLLISCCGQLVMNIPKYDGVWLALTTSKILQDKQLLSPRPATFSAATFFHAYLKNIANIYETDLYEKTTAIFLLGIVTAWAFFQYNYAIDRKTNLFNTE